MTQQTTIFGVVGSEPEQVSTRSGAPMATFRLAHNHRFFSQENNEWVQGSTSWFTVTAFRALAQNIQSSLSKGDRVFVVGRLQVREFEREDGSRGKDVGILAESVGLDLRFARGHRQSPARASDDIWGADASDTPEERHEEAASASGSQERDPSERRGAKELVGALAEPPF